MVSGFLISPNDHDRMRSGEAMEIWMELNATRVEGLDRWLFEGDPVAFPSGANVIDCGEIYVPCLGGLSDEKLCSLVRSQISERP